jgi:predicted RNA-binding protein YlxR (DUF448 family)
VPRRRCAGCGRVAPKSQLVRFAVERGRSGSGPHAVEDPAGTMPGRGAYLCRADGAGGPSPQCLALAVRRGGIARTLRAPVTLDPKIVESVGR